MTEILSNPAQPPFLGDDASFEAHMTSWPRMPQWLAEAKREAWQRFRDLPMPTRKQEAWRFASVANLACGGFTRAQGDASLAAAVEPVVTCGGCLDFADDFYAGGKPLDPELATKGVIFLPLDAALKAYPEFVKKYLFGHMPHLGSEKFEALHAALFTGGVFLYVPKNVEVALPLAALHEAVRPNAGLFPHTLVVADENSSVTLVEVFRSRESNLAHFACAASDLVALPGARISRRLIQSWSDTSLAFHLGSSTADRDSAIDSISLHLGGGHVRAEEHGRIVGRGGNVQMHSLAVATGTREIDQRTLQTHSAQDGKSDLLYKNVLTDKARTIFAGLIRVDEAAQRTDAYQTNRNLLLSPDAEASSLPGLEILANDVKCSHGMTTGQLDAEQMYYFLSRGIPRKAAEKLMVFGFFEEVLSRMGNEELSAYASGLLEKRMGAAE
jgi:Fe-S cluster assembly protein SufD